MSNSQPSGIELSTILLYALDEKQLEALGRNMYFSPQGETVARVFY